MRPRVVNAIRWRYNKLEQDNIWYYIKGDEVMYAAWSRAFLNKRLGDLSFSRMYAETLLQGPSSEGDDDNNDNDDDEEKGGEARLVRNEDEDTVRPEDSISNVEMGRLLAIPKHNSGSLEVLSSEVIRQLILRGAENLMEFKWHISFQEHGVPAAGIWRQGERLWEQAQEQQSEATGDIADL
ncbi:hypothetical protein CGRA01v4_15131 [Colletotrichum graminicola]|uniref:Uncharacterized protein n=1 Tax=Colletotrichum graminicola (strain M1.001 / M2 / FGSC 10212) TaxID=645133 RepID=E3QYY3_COLGM|nr:uncharacterized protein GLRG_11215 [Colletotrichum graminicola M1.001]EFQ36071.1 hypothetical protein GLRG_11215 [Colletotrichum graminicola M1.001]WDK23838.1 hypothetical protein CGRA01v4_15131 [Colletotrichum graminicola]